jgi:enamine deaminase RidA (YjgF/YER057c/UK114 family)
MSITRLHPSERASKIVINNGTIYLSGQVANDVSVGIQEQTQNCTDKIDALLAEAGSDKDHILSATVFLRDMKDFASMNEIWNAWMADCGKPARACVAAEMARREILVEICIVAAVKS